MLTEMIKNVIAVLNHEPFNMNFNAITFDSIAHIRLLQILSDMLQWLHSSPSIDLRNESAVDTAVRIFNALKVLRYKPPDDIGELQEWKRGIIEGEKASVVPILDWIFKHTDALKERVYLAKFLTKIDVPGAFQDIEVLELSNQIDLLMEDFKEIHANLMDARKDSLLTGDILKDLKIMEQEKEQLSRRIGAIQRKLNNVNQLDRYLELASNYRNELERREKLEFQRNEIIKHLSHIELKIRRHTAELNEVNESVKSVNPEEAIQQMKEELETYQYMVEEKLPKEIDAKRATITKLSKVVNMPAIDKNDITALQHEIERLNDEVVELLKNRERKNEETDKLSIYRHQAEAMVRKKETAAEELHEARMELQATENILEQKRKNLREKTGNNEIITVVQLKNLMNRLRSKTVSYTVKQAEIDDLKNESAVLARTADILKNQWETMKRPIEESGGKTVDSESAAQIERTRTAKPTTQKADELKRMIESLNETVLDRLSVLNESSQRNIELKGRLKELTDEYRSRKRNSEMMKIGMESELTEFKKDVKEIDEKIGNLMRKANRSETELKITQVLLNRFDTDSSKQTEPLTKQIENAIKSAVEESDKLHRELQPISDESLSFGIDQVQMWISLRRIFELKIKFSRK